MTEPGAPVERSVVPSSRAWAAPEAAASRPGAAQVQLVGGSVMGDHGGSAGVAMARGDTRADRSSDTGAVSTPFDDLDLAGPAAILDGGFELLRFRFGRLFAMAACLFLPVQMTQLAFTVSRGVDSIDTVPFVLSTSGGDRLALAMALARGVALSLLGIGVGHLVGGWLDGRDPKLGQTFAYVARRCWVAPVVVAISFALKVPAACFGGIGYFFADAVVFVASIAAGAERLGPGRAIARSWALGRAAYGTALVVCFGGFVITQVLQFVLQIGPIVLAAYFAPPDPLVVALEQFTLLILLVTQPLTACIAGRAYVQLRCQTEGLDLVRRQEARGLT